MASASEIYRAAEKYARENGVPFDQVVSDPQIMDNIDRGLNEQSLTQNSQGLAGNTPQAAANSGNALGSAAEGPRFAPLGFKSTPADYQRPAIPETALAPSAPPQQAPQAPQWARADQGLFGNPRVKEGQFEMLTRDPEPTVDRPDTPSFAPDSRVTALDEPFEARTSGKREADSTKIAPQASPAEIAEAEQSAPYRNEQWDIAGQMSGLQQKHADSPYLGPAMEALKTAKPGQTAGDLISQAAPFGFGSIAMNKAKGMGLPVNMQASRINDAMAMQQDVRQSLSRAPAPQRKPEYNAPMAPSVPRSAPKMAQNDRGPSNETVFTPTARPATYQAGAGGSYGRAMSTPAAPRTVTQRSAPPPPQRQAAPQSIAPGSPEAQKQADIYGQYAASRMAAPQLPPTPRVNAPMPMRKPTPPTIPMSKSRLQQMVKATQQLRQATTQRPQTPWDRAGVSRRAHNSAFKSGLAGTPVFNRKSGHAGVRNPKTGTNWTTYNPKTGSTWGFGKTPSRGSEGGGGGSHSPTSYDSFSDFFDALS